MPRDIRSFFKPLPSKTSSVRPPEDAETNRKSPGSKISETKPKTDKNRTDASKTKTSPKIGNKKAENRVSKKREVEIISSDDEIEVVPKRSVLKVENKSSISTDKKVEKKEIVSSDSDSDVIDGTPQVSKSRKIKKRVISSDSEDEIPKTPVKTNKQHSSKKSPKSLKPVDVSALFQRTVKQSKEVLPKQIEEVKTKSKKKQKTEIGIHEDKNFEKTLTELDDDDELFVQNADVLEKTIDEALKPVNTLEKAKTPQKVETPQVTPTPSPDKSKSTPKTPKENPSSKKRLLDDGKIKDNTPSGKSKKMKIEHTDSGFNDQEKNEKKRFCAMLYQSYKNRGAPKNHGSKEYPEGKPNCLTNLCFLKTGVLDSLESEEFEELVKKHGGRIVHGISKKVNYVVAGEDAGPAKLSKAESYKIPIIDEDQFLDIILEKSGKPKKYKNTSSFEDAGICDSFKNSSESEEIQLDEDNSVENGVSKSAEETPVKMEVETRTTEEVKGENDEEIYVCLSEKYKPKALKEIIGHQLNDSGMNRLKIWLENWENNEKLRKLKKIRQPTPWDKNHNGSYYKCALLSGPPGVGKTTTATLVAKSLNYDIVEFNASDTRSKRLLQEDIANALGTKTISNYNSDDKKITSCETKRILIMDEVDGMSGNEDRGGMQELIRLIKISKIPIICMCNDRNHQKIRSLSNYCFDLRFEKPRPQQLMGFVMSICCKEGIKMTPQIAMEIINGTGCDVRQTLNQIAMISNVGSELSLEQAHKDALASKKDTILGPWQVTRMVFDENEQKNMSLIDKSRLFFYDYSFGPLYVQENYLKVVPRSSNKMKSVAAAADAISKGATISRIIRETNNWSLLDTQAIFSSVLPGHYMSGKFNGSVEFPGFLGKLSKKNKLKRLQTELYNHTQMVTTGGALAISQDYCKPLLKSIVTPLKKRGLDGVHEAVDVMKSYQLLREDLDSLVELSTWSRQKNLMDGIDSKVKTAFTKLYNKEAPLFSHSISSGTSKKKAAAVTGENEFEDDDEDGEEEESSDNIGADKTIKVKTTRKTKTAGKSEGKATNSKPKSSSKGGKKK